MFTGLIEKVCTVKTARRMSAGLELTVDLDKLAEDVKIGDSIAVNGACLTVTGIRNSLVSFDVSPETVTKSNIGRLKSGSKVNIETAIRPASLLSGHIVQGHVDGTAKIKKIENKDRFYDMTFSADNELLEQMVAKGSVAADGVSLTIASINSSTFTVAIIPQTWQKTTLSLAKTGDLVNIETDIITKTVRRQLERILPQQNALTIEKLKDFGF